ncbi:hypothetical protein LSG25_12850 [Paralcaligenes sp. KSB-10]|uniref:hypothetical protein n=1 Tax=Paralcaligenes sp. KSB-10 TaxID=2901142 RepID=UPI001E2BA747|nr:hypothetical protein [Paralcaligenes sp. KSB-10]UHL62958.1 hypothetical protein LSG25_12850 [Paralcaligenes sp. KSB-10]
MKGFSSPHLLLASTNPLKMIQNLNHLLQPEELAKLTAELDKNAKELFALGESHLMFAAPLSDTAWRQKISRLYYAVYNLRRSVVLKASGRFSTDSSDHNSVDQLPDGINNRESYILKLRSLREDRNLADYSHQAVITDLVISSADALVFANGFCSDCRSFLLSKYGLIV